jgi:hypothetical protein
LERIAVSFFEKLCVFLTELLVIALAALDLFDEFDFVGVFQRRMNSAYIDELAILGERFHPLSAVPMVDS